MDGGPTHRPLHMVFVAFLHRLLPDGQPVVLFCCKRDKEGDACKGDMLGCKGFSDSGAEEPPTPATDLHNFTL